MFNVFCPQNLRLMYKRNSQNCIKETKLILTLCTLLSNTTCKQTNWLKKQNYKKGNQYFKAANKCKYSIQTGMMKMFIYPYCYVTKKQSYFFKMQKNKIYFFLRNIIFSKITFQTQYLLHKSSKFGFYANFKIFLATEIKD